MRSMLLVLAVVILLTVTAHADGLSYSRAETAQTSGSSPAGHMHDVAAVSLIVPPMVEGGKMQLVQAVTENRGLAAESYTVELGYLEWDSTFVVTRTKTAEEVPAGERKNISFGFYTFPNNIEYNYFVRVVLDTDENMDNNVITRAVNSFETPRTVVLIEKATGTWCGHCPGASRCVDQLVNDYSGQVAAIDYHVGDEFEHELCRARANYYEVQGYPTAKFNGMSEIVRGSSAFAWEDLYRNNYRKRFTAGLTHGTCLDMDFTYMEKDGKVTANVNLTGLATSYVDSYRIFYVVVESHIAHKWGGLDSLQHVFRGVYPGWNGVPFITDQHIDIGVTFSSSLEFDFPTNVVKENCELFAFVQNIDNGAVTVAAIGAKVEPPVIPYALMVHDTAAIDTAGKEIAFSGMVHNLLDTEVTIQFDRLVNDIPQAWTSSICLEYCLAPFVDQASAKVAAQDSLEFSIHFFTAEGTADSGMVVMQISDSTGLQQDSVTFKAATLQMPTGVAHQSAPATFELEGNYPNPFNPSTTIAYSVAANGTSARLQIYSLLGQLVHEESLSHAAGAHTFTFDAGHLSAGVYVYRMVFEGTSGRIVSAPHKLTLLK